MTSGNEFVIGLFTKNGNLELFPVQTILSNIKDLDGYVRWEYDITYTDEYGRPHHYGEKGEGRSRDLELSILRDRVSSHFDGEVPEIALVSVNGGPNTPLAKLVWTKPC